MQIQFIPYEDGSKHKAIEGAGNILNLDFAKPRPVGQVIPDWFKHLPAFIDRPLTPGAGTAKASHCYAQENEREWENMRQEYHD